MVRRSPLSVIHAGLELLQEELRRLVGAPMPSAMELLEDIYSSSELAINIMNDLLNYEDLEEGEPTPLLSSDG
jgi:signal transduction histidine kinase